MTLYSLELIPEPQVSFWLKCPYDEEFHKLLKASAERCLKFMDDGSNGFVTHKGVILFNSDNGLQAKILSYFTAYANYYWNERNRLLTFSAVQQRWSEDAYKVCSYIIDVQRLSRASYDMYVEDCRTATANSLFPDHTILPYEKTPKFFREGIWLRDERIVP